VSTDNSQILRTVYEQLSQAGRTDGRGAIYAFTAAHTGVGTSFTAREMALIAAQSAPQGQQVLLVDMDISNNSQSGYFFAPDSQNHYGIPSGPYDACFAAKPFWQVTPAMVGKNGENISDSNFMSLHILEAISLAFTAFHWENFREGQTVQLQNARDYWHKLRDHFSAVIIDTPALDRADILSTIAAEVDTSILVASTPTSKDSALGAAYARITSLGGRCAGVILNDGPVPLAEYGGAS